MGARRFPPMRFPFLRKKDDALHSLRKLRSTTRMCFCMFMARTFGTYQHTVCDYSLDYAVYEWRGKTWAIPTGPMEDEGV